MTSQLKVFMYALTSILISACHTPANLSLPSDAALQPAFFTEEGFDCSSNEICSFKGGYYVSFLDSPSPAAVFRYDTQCVLALTSKSIQYDMIEAAWLYSDLPKTALKKNAKIMGELSGKAISRSDFKFENTLDQDQNIGTYSGSKANLNYCPDSPYIILTHSFELGIYSGFPY